MTDTGFIPNTSASDIQIFQGQSTGTMTGVHVWVKPRNVSLLFLYCMGSGGGGGGGFT